MFIFLIPCFYAGALQQQCNNEMRMTTIFYITKYWGDKNIVSPPVQKLGHVPTSPLKLGLWLSVTFLCNPKKYENCLQTTHISKLRSSDIQWRF